LDLPFFRALFEDLIRFLAFVQRLLFFGPDALLVGHQMGMP
jgi:hypothetical protein